MIAMLLLFHNENARCIDISTSDEYMLLFFYLKHCTKICLFSLSQVII